MSLKSPLSLADRGKSTVSIQQNKMLFRDGRLYSEEDAEPNEEESDDQKEASVLVREQRWLKAFNTHRAFLKLKKILEDCCRCLHLSNKLDSSIELGAQTCASETLHLKQRNGQDAFKVSVVLVGENIIQSEVNFKYPKAAGGILRTSAQPEVQWKLQQLQDTGNYCCLALNAISKGLNFARAENGGYEELLAPEAGNQLSSLVNLVNELVIQARSSLCIPRKRTLLELCNFPPTRCFKPSLPSDLVFSYYVASTRIVCAAYHITSKQSDGRNGLTVTLAECELPLLVNLLASLNQAVEVVRELRLNLSLFESHVHAPPSFDPAPVHL